METLLERYTRLHETPSDINQHLDTLCEFVKLCDADDEIVEFGTRAAVSTTALLYGLPRRLISVDIDRRPEVDEIERLAAENGVQYDFINADTTTFEIGRPVGLLFIDTKHTYEQLTAELQHNSKFVTRYIILHDTTTYGVKGEGGGLGLLQAMKEQLPMSEWNTVLSAPQNNGLMVLRRKAAI